MDFLLEHQHLGEEYLQPLSHMIEEGGADVGKVPVGQNSSLVWTREGIKFQFPKKSKARRFVSKLLNPFGKQEKAESTPREGDRVSMDFFCLNIRRFVKSSYVLGTLAPVKFQRRPLQ